MLTTTAKGFIFWNTQIENKFKGDSYNVQNFSVDDEGQITLLTISYSSSRKFAEDVELNLTIGDEYGVKTYSTPVPKREIWQAKMLKLKNGNIFIAGYYTNERKGMEAGLATTFFNVDKKLFTKVRFTDFKATKDAAKAKKKKKSSVKGVSKVKKSKKSKQKAKAAAAAAKKQAKSKAKENVKEPKPEDFRYIMLDMFERPNGSIAIFGEQRAVEKEKTKNGEISNLFAKNIVYNSVTAKGAVSEYIINKNQLGIGGAGETNHRLGGISFFVGQAGPEIYVIYNDLKTNEPNAPEDIYQQQGFVDGVMVLCTINEKNKMTFRKIEGADDNEAPYNIIQYKNGVVYAVRKTRANYILTRLPLK